MRLAFIAVLSLLPMFSTSHLSAQEPPAQPPLAEQVAALTKDFKGTVVLYAKNLKHGKEFEIAADTKVRTASTIKLPILAALESLVAAGKVKWDERITLKPGDKVSGSGVLASLADNTDLTVRNLAILMIIVSDNTATNLILDRITADAVNDYLDTIGLTATRSNRKVRGDGTKLAAPTGWSKAGQKEENSKFGLGVSTPREMVKLLEMLHQGKIVSPEASKDILAIMKDQQVQGRHRPPRARRLDRRQQERLARRPPLRRRHRLHQVRPDRARHHRRWHARHRLLPRQRRRHPHLEDGAGARRGSGEVRLRIGDSSTCAEGVGRAVQQLTHLPQQHFRSERLLQERFVAVRYARAAASRRPYSPR